MTDDEHEDAEAEAVQRMQQMEQSAAAFRELAESVCLIRRTLVEGGFPDDVASRMAERAWAMFFPGVPPSLGFLFGSQS
jgi:hypothetical protein